MKSSILAATILSVLALVPIPAHAGSILSSPPLKGGAGGLICSCVSIGGKTVTVDIGYKHASGSFGCDGKLADSNRFPASCDTGFTGTATCEVVRVDGKGLSPKQVACTLMAVDGAGNPLAVVPVNQRPKQ